MNESDFTVIAFRALSPLDPESFQDLMKRFSIAIFRGKRIFHVAGMAERLIFHQVGDRCAVQPEAPWGKEEERMTELVFIGRGVDREALLADLSACLKEEKAQTNGRCGKIAPQTSLWRIANKVAADRSAAPAFGERNLWLILFRAHHGLRKSPCCQTS